MNSQQKYNCIVMAFFLPLLPLAAEECKCKAKPLPQKLATKGGPSKAPDAHIQEVTIQCAPPVAASSTNNPTLEPLKTLREGSASIDKLLEAIAKILSSIAWPIAAGVIAYHFKKELAALLARLKRIKAGATEAEFAEQLRETEEEVDIARTSDAQFIPPSTLEEATKNPRGSILSSWIEVESAIRNVYEAKRLSRPALRSSRGILPLMREIQKAELLDVGYVALFHDLRSLRNDAAHDPEFNPAPELVIRYLQLTRELTAALRNIAASA